MEWISVEDQLPVPYDYVLVWFDAGETNVEVANYDQEERAWVLPHDDFNFADDSPTHWMPLPAPPDQGSG